VLQHGRLVPAFRNNILPPHSVLKTNIGKCAIRVTQKSCTSSAYCASSLQCGAPALTLRKLNFSYRVYLYVPDNSHKKITVISFWPDIWLVTGLFSHPQIESVSDICVTYLTSFSQPTIRYIDIAENVGRFTISRSNIQKPAFSKGISTNILHNEELRDLYSSPSIIRITKSRRMRWPGHVARMGDKRKAYRLLVGKPKGKRPLGRPRRR
jgi:hypothetical protein